MAQKLFDIDDRDLKKLIKFYKNAPKLMKHSVAGMLNSFAFGTRSRAMHIIRTNMNIRAKKFVDSSIRVQMAKASQEINQQHSIVGSISRARFSGWEEQELGKKTKRTRVATLLGRGGNVQKKIQPSARLKQSNQFVSPDDYPGTSRHNRSVVMMQDLFRKRHRKPFIVKGHRRFKSGLYKIKQKKLRMLQSFEPRNVQPKRIRWMSGGRKAFFRKADIRQMWGKQLNRTFKKFKL